MEYEVQLVSVNKTILDPKGVIDPLCVNCVTPDCSNPIRECTISIFGKPKMTRLYVMNNLRSQVVGCSGYTGPKILNDAKTQGSNLNISTDAVRDTTNREKS